MQRTIFRNAILFTTDCASTVGAMANIQVIRAKGVRLSFANG
jgi:hypothetical protein